MTLSKIIQDMQGPKSLVQILGGSFSGGYFPGQQVELFADHSKVFSDPREKLLGREDSCTDGPTDEEVCKLAMKLEKEIWR